jgi:flagellar capping protein FliD
MSEPDLNKVFKEVHELVTKYNELARQNKLSSYLTVEEVEDDPSEMEDSWNGSGCEWESSSC